MHKNPHLFYRLLHFSFFNILTPHCVAVCQPRSLHFDRPAQRETQNFPILMNSREIRCASVNDSREREKAEYFSDIYQKSYDAARFITIFFPRVFVTSGCLQESCLQDRSETHLTEEPTNIFISSSISRFRALVLFGFSLLIYIFANLSFSLPLLDYLLTFAPAYARVVAL